jgi:hypothetical protein
MISTVLWFLYGFLSLKNDVNVPSRVQKVIRKRYLNGIIVYGINSLLLYVHFIISENTLSH